MVEQVIRLAEQRRLQQQSALRLSVHNAAGGDPEQAAEVTRLAEKHNVPRATVQRELQAMRRRDKYYDVNIDKIEESAPKLAEFLRDPTNSAIAIDDISNLMKLEQEANKQAPHFNKSRNFLRRWSEITGNLVEVVGRGMAAMGRATESAIGDYIPEALRGGPDLAGKITEFGKEVSGEVPKTYGYVPEYTWDKFKGDMTPGNLAQFILETGSASLADMVASMYTLPAYIASRTEEIAEVRAGDKSPKTEDLLSSLVPAVTTSLMERIGSVGVFKGKTATTYTGAVKEGLRAGGREGGLEFGQEIIEYLGEELGTGREVSINVALDRAFAGLVAGTGMGVGVRAPVATIEAAVATSQAKYNKAVEAASKRIQSASEQDQLDALLKAAEDPKLAQLDPKRYQQYMQEVVNRTVHVSPDVLTQLRNEGQVFPEEVSRQLDESTGADIDLPVTYLMQNPEVAKRIRSEVRASETGMTRSELEVGGVEDIRKLISEAQKNAEEVDRATQIYEQVTNELVSTGRMSEQTARIQAQLIPAYVTTAAQRRGITVDEVYKSMGLSIVGPEAKAPSATESRPVLNAEGIKISEQVKVAETGEIVTIEQDAQRVFDRLEKRRNVVSKLKDCLNV